MNLGRSAESPSASRRRLTAAFRPWSYSTKRSRAQRSRTLARHQFAGTFQQHAQHNKRLVGEAQLDPPPAQFLGSQVCLEVPETNVESSLSSFSDRRMVTNWRRPCAPG